MKLNEKWILFLIATLVTFSGIWYSLFKGTAASDVPANLAFDDINFYMCVVDAYNKENDINLSYATSLSDAQLGTIKEVYCIGEAKEEGDKVVSTTGL